jgi:hypothetical protein
MTLHFLLPLIMMPSSLLYLGIRTILLQTAFALKPNPALLVFNWLSIPYLRFFFSLFYPF